MQTDLDRSTLYAPDNRTALYADCPLCDESYGLGVAAPAGDLEVACAKCGTPFIIESPREESHGHARA